MPVAWWEGEQLAERRHRGRELLSRLLRIPAKRFEREHWLRSPYFGKLSAAERAAVIADKSHWCHLLSVKGVRTLLGRKRPRPTRWLHDVDATKYDAATARRTALSTGDGEVDANDAWNAYTARGFSLRLVHPQQWHDGCYELCAYLQEYFGFATGCSAYLTPAGAQGFPPHYDDVEVFVLQLEGAKRWRLYDRPDSARAPGATKTTEFTAAQLGEPTAELTLRPGDVLYLPRGVVHQAVSLDNSHSLHLTVSTYQRHRWRDVLARGLSARSAQALDATAGAAAGGWLHSGVPTSLLDVHTAGRPELAWERLGPLLEEQQLPAALLRELGRAGGLARALDATATAFLFDSLPPPGPPPPPPPPRLKRSTLLRLRAPRCARLVDASSPGAGSGAGGTLERWEAGEGAEPRLELRTNVANGRTFASPASPAFEMLPTVARSILELLDAPWPRATAVGRLAGFAGSKAERADLMHTLLLLVEHGVLVIASPRRKASREEDNL